MSRDFGEESADRLMWMETAEDRIGTPDLVGVLSPEDSLDTETEPLAWILEGTRLTLDIMELGPVPCEEGGPFGCHGDPLSRLGEMCTFAWQQMDRLASSMDDLERDLELAVAEQRRRFLELEF